MGAMKPVSIENIDNLYDFNNVNDCRSFLLNLYVRGKRVEYVELADGVVVNMEDIPEDQIVMRANELRCWFIDNVGIQ